MPGFVDKMGGGKGIGKFKTIPTLSQSLRASRFRIRKGVKIQCTFIITITSEKPISGEKLAVLQRERKESAYNSSTEETTEDLESESASMLSRSHI